MEVSLNYGLEVTRRILKAKNKGRMIDVRFQIVIKGFLQPQKKVDERETI